MQQIPEENHDPDKHKLKAICSLWVRAGGREAFWRGALGRPLGSSNALGPKAQGETGEDGFLWAAAAFWCKRAFMF